MHFGDVAVLDADLHVAGRDSCHRPWRAGPDSSVSLPAAAQAAVGTVMTFFAAATTKVTWALICVISFWSGLATSNSAS